MNGNSVSPLFKEFVSSLIPISEGFMQGSTASLTLLKDPQGKFFVSKRIVKNDQDDFWKNTTEMLYSNEIEALHATQNCPDTPKIVAWKVGKHDSCFEVDDQIVMEYIDSIQIPKGTILPGHIAASIAFFLLRALHTLHKSELVHRDVKPDNILISKEGHVKLVDFGLCTKSSNMAQTSSPLGTYRYMAPEILSDSTSGQIDCRSDIWSLGIALIEWLLGYNPILMNNESEVEQSLGPMRFLSTKTLVLNQIKMLHGADCEDFLRKCIVELSEREDAEQLLSHQWITNNTQGVSEDKLRKEIMYCLSTFSTQISTQTTPQTPQTPKTPISQSISQSPSQIPQITISF